MSGFPERVSVIDVGPRDGLQSEPNWVSSEDKIELINGLIDAGIRHLEVTSFVSPRAVPQMRDAAEVLAGIDRSKGAVLTALVPNARGAERAVEAGIDAMVVFMSASGTACPIAWHRSWTSGGVAIPVVSPSDSMVMPMSR